MSAGRGRGTNNMRQSQDNRRELRRPMGGDEELARGMNRMDPFGYGQYGGGGGGDGGRYGMQNQFEPPRPAPNAEGWSSGDDFLAWNDQNQHHFEGNNSQFHQQQQQQQHRTPAQSRLQYNQQHYQRQQQWSQAAQYQQQQPSWNIGASEFVPKSNLSVSAEEFVPRTMARNTSQWAYQQQQHHPAAGGNDYSSQQYGYQPQQQQQPPMNYQGYGSGGGGGGGSHSSGGGSHFYDPCEVLSDAIATVVFMPSKFERTTMHLAEKFNSSLEDSATMSSLVDSLVEQCLKEEQFLTLAGRLCSYLALKVSVQADGATMRSLLLQRFDQLTNQCENLLQTNEKRVHNFITIMVDMYLYLVEKPEQKWLAHDPKLAANIDTVFTVLFKNGKEANVGLAAQKLKLCGKTLEGEEKFASIADASQIDEEKSWTEHQAPKMEALFSMVTSLQGKSDLSANLQKDLKALVDTRTNDRWATAEADNAKAREESAKSMAKAAPRKSAAIRIEPDPNDARTHQQVAPTTSSNNKPDGELTEEELRFMTESIGEEDVSEDGGDNEEIEESDNGMTEDIADAYEQFLAEQSKNGGK